MKHSKFIRFRDEKIYFPSIHISIISKLKSKTPIKSNLINEKNDNDGCGENKMWINDDYSSFISAMDSNFSRAR